MGQEHTIDEWKERLGFPSDQALANEIGVERSTVGQWRRKSVPKPICKLLGLMEDKKNGRIRQRE